MKTTYKFILQNNMTQDEEIDLLEKVITYGGTTWFAHVLKEEEIVGRTKLVDSFRSGTVYKYNYTTRKGVASTIPGRSAQDRQDSLNTLLKQRKLELWVESFLGAFTVASLTYCISSTIERDFNYIIDVSCIN